MSYRGHPENWMDFFRGRDIASLKWGWVTTYFSPGIKKKSRTNRVKKWMHEEWHQDGIHESWSVYEQSL